MKKIIDICKVLLGLAAVASSATAVAEESAFSIAAADRSLADGLGVSSANVFQRVAANPSAVATSLINALGAPPVAPSQSRDGSLHLLTGEWTLDISADGTWAHGARPIDYAKGSSSRLDATLLESLARAFVSESLGDVVALDPTEALVAVRTSYLIRGGQSVDGQRDPDVVLGNRILLGRAINGLRVVGGGSTIAVTFSSDGQLLAFDLDWPIYRIVKTVEVAQHETLMDRVQKVSTRRSGGPSDAPVPNGVAFPITLSSDMQLTRLECGYYDRGGQFGASAPVQPACQYQVTTTRKEAAGQLRAGYAGAVPAALKFDSDSGWHETEVLAGQLETLGPSAPNAAK